MFSPEIVRRQISTDAINLRTVFLEGGIEFNQKPHKSARFLGSTSILGKPTEQEWAFKSALQEREIPLLAFASLREVPRHALVYVHILLSRLAAMDRSVKLSDPDAFDPRTKIGQFVKDLLIEPLDDSLPKLKATHTRNGSMPFCADVEPGFYGGFEDDTNWVEDAGSGLLLLRKVSHDSNALTLGESQIGDRTFPTGTVVYNPARPGIVPGRISAFSLPSVESNLIFRMTHYNNITPATLQTGVTKMAELIESPKP